MSESQTSDGGFVDGLERSKHLALDGRRLELWIPRGILALLLGFSLAALLNVFGQETTTSRASAPAATLEVRTPPRVRGGLLFNTRIAVHARRTLQQPTLVLDHGYFESTTFNGVVPDPKNWSSASDGRPELVYEKLAAGHTLIVWISWQANPPDAAHRSDAVELRDGTSPIARVKRTVTVFP